MTKAVPFNQMEGKLELAEPVFLSVQGEGKYVGTPTWFIRFKKCNKKCTFCDTPLDGLEVLINEEAVMGLVMRSSCQTVTFTGGEPLLYQDVILDIIRKYPQLTVHCESNGSLPLNFQFKHKLRTHWCFSPKSVEDVTQVVQNCYTAREYSLKVLYGMDRFDEILQELHLQGISRKNIMLMPLGKTVEELEAITSDCIDYAVENGYRVSPRCHIGWRVK